MVPGHIAPPRITRGASGSQRSRELIMRREMKSTRLLGTSGNLEAKYRVVGLWAMYMSDRGCGESQLSCGTSLQCGGIWDRLVLRISWDHDRRLQTKPQHSRGSGVLRTIDTTRGKVFQRNNLSRRSKMMTISRVIEAMSFLVSGTPFVLHA